MFKCQPLLRITCREVPDTHIWSDPNAFQTSLSVILKLLDQQWQLKLAAETTFTPKKLIYDNGTFPEQAYRFFLDSDHYPLMELCRSCRITCCKARGMHAKNLVTALEVEPVIPYLFPKYDDSPYLTLISTFVHEMNTFAETFRPDTNEVTYLVDEFITFGSVLIAMMRIELLGVNWFKDLMDLFANRRRSSGKGVRDKLKGVHIYIFSEGLHGQLNQLYS
ncbi:hypothetical protein L596_025096 [Steinernema carpocapsae]|uniref:Uncharacterized protein n=1 Tax=Steinernema carpocapsae TaxID=34508 RepID=A0A4U5M6T4_STECR|nr:hypothetical protein L596_025096 [Steinernema carpocapsae]